MRTDKFSVCCSVSLLAHFESDSCVVVLIDVSISFEVKSASDVGFFLIRPDLETPVTWLSKIEKKWLQ